MKKWISISLQVAACLLMASCGKDAVNTCKTNTKYIKIEATVGIPKNVNTLTELDAATVAKLFMEKQCKTRSESLKAIKNVVTISDEFGKPAIYAVNFEDGYIWISATKKLSPILAAVEHGTFSLDNLAIGTEKKNIWN